MCIVTAGLVVIETLPHLPYGKIQLGRNDVVFIANYNNYSGETEFNSTEGNIEFYQESCPDVKTERQSINYTSELSIPSDRHRSYVIDEYYLAKGSHVQYSFSVASGSQVSDCVATVLVFTNYTEYKAFRDPYSLNPYTEDSSYCISAQSPISFSLPLSGSEDSYHFLGLESSTSERVSIEYSAQGDVILYNTSTNASLSCSFPTKDCVLPLDYSLGKDICVLASLRDSDISFVSLNISTSWGKRYRTQFTAGFAVLFTFAGITVFMFTGLVTVAVLYVIVRDEGANCRKLFTMAP